MTQSLDNVAVEQFRDQFVLEYAGARKLAGMLTEVHGVVGRSYQWPVAGSAVMIDRGSAQSLIPASDVSHTPIVTTMAPKVLNLPTDLFQQAEVNANERTMLAKRHVGAVGRTEDQFALNAMNAATVDVTIPVDTSNLTVAKLRLVSRAFNVANVPASERFIAVHADQLESLLRETEVTSSDFNVVRALVNGELDTYLGLKFTVFGDLAEGGLPKTGDDRTCFAWHIDSMGQTWNVEPGVNVEWSVERQSWVSVSRVSSGASNLLSNGLIKIICDETL